MKRFLFSLLCGMLCMSMLVGCGQTSEQSESDSSVGQTTQAPTQATEQAPEQSTPEQTTQEMTEVTTYDPATLSTQTYTLTSDTAHFKQHGRLIPLSDGLGCDHVMSGIEFEGIMYGKVTLTLACDRDTYFTVWIDGVRSETRFFASTDTAELTVAEFDTAQMHNVRILKQTEPQFSLCTLKSVTLTGELTDAPAQKPLYIEVLGDSISSGYGLLGKTTSENPGGAEWHDGTQTYAALSIEALGADCSIISCSGIGANKGFPFFDMQQYYQKASFFRDWTSASSDHVFGRVPDLVIINLGTNDFSQGATEQGYKDSVRRLITLIRTSYGKDIPIVWVHNMMGNCRFEWTEPVLQELGGEAAGIYTLRANANHNGTNGHPNLMGHKNVSRRLTALLQDLLAGQAAAE